MSGKEQAQSSGTWYGVIQGKFRTKVSEDTPGAEARKWETPDGKSGIKYELVYNALFGTIQNIQIVDGEYGEQVIITLDETEDGETPIIALSVTSKYGIDLLKRLPGIDLTKEVRLMPFQFEDENGREREGIQVTHKDADGKFTVKVNNYFSDGEKALHGFPEADENAKEEWSKADWRNYFGYTVPKFLTKHAKENVISKIAPVKQNKGYEYPQEELSSEDIPFSSEHQSL